MNILKIFLLALIPFLFTACANETAPEEETPEMSVPAPAENPISVTGTDIGTAAGQPAAQPATGTVGSKQHYYCPNSCAGSGGDAGGKCPTCGTDYVHNDAYHLQGAAAPEVAAPDPAKVEPPQNAKGVWHYSCPKGCEGGAGAAGPCAKCGTALAHNGTYHN